MGKKKIPRRSISVRGVTYQRVLNYLKKQPEPHSVSGLIEDLIADFLKHKEPVPTEVTDFAQRPKKKTEPDDPTGGGIFSF